MITERQEELAALYALGLLEGAEREAFEAELSSNPELARRARQLQETTADLALSAPPMVPPPELRERVLAAVGSAASQPAAPAPVTRFRFAPWGLAAALAVFAGLLGYGNRVLREENQSLRDEYRLAEAAFRTAQTQLTQRSELADQTAADLRERLRRFENLSRLKVAALASLAGNTREAQAIAVWDPDQQAGLLTFDKMPVIAASQDYQIWVVDPAYPNPVNGGVFQVDANGRATLAFKPDQPVPAAAAFAISLEKKGGVPKAEGPIVLLGKLPTF